MDARDQHRGQQVVDWADVAGEDEQRTVRGEFGALDFLAQAKDADASPVEGASPPALELEVTLQVAFAIAAPGDPDPGGDQYAGGLAGQEDMDHGDRADGGEPAPGGQINNGGDGVNHGSGDQRQEPGQEEGRDGDSPPRQDMESRLLPREAPDRDCFGPGRSNSHWLRILRLCGGHACRPGVRFAGATAGEWERCRCRDLRRRCGGQFAARFPHRGRP